MSDASKSSAGNQRWEVHFSGRVQGVGFRYTAREIATRFPVVGFVKNLSDGRVLLVVEGSERALKEYLEALADEMDRHIDARETEVAPASHEFSSFEVRR